MHSVRTASVLWVCLAMFGMAASLPAVEETPATAQVLDNTMCPVLTDEPVDPAVFVEYQGKRVYFCCNRCRGQFTSSPEKYLAHLPQFAGAALAAALTASAPAATGEGARATALPPPAPEPEPAAAGEQPRALSARLFEFIGKFHVVVVHFPIALLLAAAFAELLVLGGCGSGTATRFCLTLGTLGALVAAPLGWIAATAEDYSGRLAQALFIHRWLGTSTAALAVVALVLYQLQGRRPAAAGARMRLWARLLLFLAAALVGLTGHFGGGLVFGLDYYQF